MIDSNAVVVYNYMAKIFGWDNINSLEEMPKQFIGRTPKLIKEIYNIDTNSKISEMYSILGSTYLIKVDLNNEVKELYIMNPTNTKDAYIIAKNVENLEPIEYYINKQNTIEKYDYKTDKLLQVNNYVSSFEELPKEYKENLKDFEHKDRIFLYAKKPYGRIVEVSL
jgi:hypothetical protein